MLINQNTTIIGKKCILVPYKKEHVLKYHEWMKSEELQKLTGSLPLSLDEEYAMQQSWLNDENKCTFIILSREKHDETKNPVESMIGDTNLFLMKNEQNHLSAEASIMIAEKSARGRKHGSEAVILMILFGIETLKIEEFIVKIADDNDTSINMFKTLGFHQTSHSEYFQETTLTKTVDRAWIETLHNKVGDFQIMKQ